MFAHDDQAATGVLQIPPHCIGDQRIDLRRVLPDEIASVPASYHAGVHIPGSFQHAFSLMFTPPFQCRFPCFPQDVNKGWVRVSARSAGILASCATTLD